MVVSLLFNNLSEDRKENTADADNEISSYEQPETKGGFLSVDNLATFDSDYSAFQADNTKPYKSAACQNDRQS